jgi:hypothetical protein
MKHEGYRVFADGSHGHLGDPGKRLSAGGRWRRRHRLGRFPRGDAGDAGSTRQPGIQPDGTFVTNCPNLYQSNTRGPPGVGPPPSPEQASYQHAELTAYIHLSLATFDGTEQGNPADKGGFNQADSALLQQFGSWYSSLYRNNALAAQPTKADSTWAAAGFGGDKAVDEDICTYSAVAEGKTSARLEVNPASPISFSVLSIREPIELGERSKAYHVELKQNGAWNKAPKDSSGNQIKGTAIGQRQLWQLGQTTAEAIALVVDSAGGVPAISELGAY